MELQPPLPVILTKVEALEWAAKMLEDNASGMSLAFAIIGSIDKVSGAPSLPPEISAEIARVRMATVDPKLQLAAMREGAKAVRDLALEERIIAARMQAGAGIKA